MAESKPFLGWDKTPEARARYKDILGNPADPRFYSLAVELLTKTTDTKTVFDYIPPETLIRAWARLGPKLSEVSPLDTRIWWDTVISTLRKKFSGEKPADNHPKSKRPKHSDPILLDLGQRFRIRRKQANETIENYARRLRTTPNIVSKLERGLYNPTYKWLMERADIVLGDDVYMPPLYPATPYPTRIERSVNGYIVWTDGKNTIDLSDLTDRAGGYLSLAGNPNDFFERIYFSLGDSRAAWDALHDTIKSKGVSIHVMYRVLQMQYKILLEKQSHGEHRDRAATENRLDEFRKELCRIYANKNGDASMWIALAPIHAAGATPNIIDVKRKQVVDDLFELLSVPGVGGIRENGWTPRSLNNPGQSSSGEYVEFGNPDTSFRPFRVYCDGTIAFLEPDKKLLEWILPNPMKESVGKHTLYPYTAVEYPVSFFRYAAAVWKKYEMVNHLRWAVGEIVFGPAEDWILLPEHPESVNYMVAAQMMSQTAKQSDSPYVHVRRNFHVKNILKNADFTAWHLIVPFYEAFGHGHQSIPFYKPEEGVFQIP